MTIYILTKGDPEGSAILSVDTNLDNLIKKATQEIEDDLGFCTYIDCEAARGPYWNGSIIVRCWLESPARLAHISIEMWEMAVPSTLDNA